MEDTSVFVVKNIQRKQSAIIKYFSYRLFLILHFFIFNTLFNLMLK